MLDLLRGAHNLQTTRSSTITIFNVFTYSGINPPEKYRFFYFVYSLSLNFGQILCLPASFLVSFFVTSNNLTISQLLLSLQVAFNIWGIPLKFLAMINHKWRLRKSEELMDHLDGRCTQPVEFAKIHHCITFSNRSTVILGYTYAFYGVLTFIAAMIQGRVLYSIYIPWVDWHHSKWEFYAQAFVEYFFLNVTCLHQSALDSYPMVYIYIIRTHMQLLVERVKKLGLDPESSKEQNYQDLIDCIKDHKTLINLQDIISPAISITIFIQFAITAVMLGTSMINIFIFSDPSARIPSVAYLFAVLVQTAPTCYQATRLIDDCEKLPIAIFQCNWLQQDIRFRKMLIYFTMRSQQPITFMSMKLVPIGLETSLSIGKFSFSLYTFIKGFDIEQKAKNYNA